ncbi:hypothetical protein [Novosphingobium sp. FSW06-99]|uniref:hypothetical protein n=1 Tax=Novosphingobium sp. FSW06-99 TaxID=1739113 RepID=UPI00076C214F|nr:hypothetical protein [Novosphingobium sp. FSW06-99]KUR76005.1 hypothetical protein AQZ49_13300 [Novosphingobium sp. FSW06-99]
MKSISALVAAVSLMLIGVQPVLADPPMPPAAPVAPAAKFTLDTPIETLVADPRAKTVLDTNLPGLTTHPQFDQFKSMSLTALSGFAPDKLTPDKLDKVKTELASLN